MRRLAWIGFTFAGAILLAAALLPAGWALLFCALAAAGLGLSLLRERLRRGFLPLLLLGAALGFGWFSFREAITLSPARALDGQSGVWEATVESFPKPAVTTTMVNLTLETEEGRVAARLYSFEDAAELLRPGDRVSVRAALALANRMDEEETGYWFSEGVFLTLRSARELTLLSRPEKLGLRHTLLSWGEALRGALAAAFPEDVSALAVALVTGDKTGLAEHRLALRRAGIYHLATVSGLHIAIIAGFFHTLFGNRRWAGLLIAPFLLAFAGMVGFAPSVTRAVVMQLFLLAAPLFLRENDSFTALSAALVLLLTLNPWAALHIGLQLSFAATLGILLFSQKILDFLVRPLKSGRHRLLRALCSALAVTLAAITLTLPLTALYFGAISVAAPVTNLLVTFAVSPALLLAALAGGAWLLSPAVGSAVGFCAAPLLRYILFVAHLIGESPAAEVKTGNLWAGLWLAFLYLVLLTALLLKPGKRRLALPVALCVAGLCFLLMRENAVGLSGYRLTMLDVGQGQCLVLTAGSFTAVIDCGTDSYNRDAGSLCLSHLAEERRKSVDLLLLTHYDADHVNGVKALLAGISVGAVLAPTPQKEAEPTAAELIAAAHAAGTEFHYITSDTLVSLGSTALTIFAPVSAAAENDRGLAVLAADGGFETLVTGDMAAPTEQLLLGLKKLPDIEVLVVGHHGSADATAGALLTAVKPEAGLISVGKNNGYGHPSPSTLQRLEAARVTVFRTDKMGSISITTQGEITYGG